jgi:hypothetical protein
VTEAEWLTATDPTPMLEFLEDKTSDRKLRLFAVACCRRVWSLLPDPQSRKAVEVVARFADGEATDEERLAAIAAADSDYYGRFGTRETPGGWPENPVVAAGYYDAGLAALCAAGSAAEAEASSSRPLPFTQIALLRCGFGNPFSPIAVDPSWLTSAVVGLARAIYDGRAFDLMPILADALQDGGCANDDVLNHCRNDGVHVRGCWVVDLLLGKE